MQPAAVEAVHELLEASRERVPLRRQVVALLHLALRHQRADVAREHVQEVLVGLRELARDRQQRREVAVDELVGVHGVELEVLRQVTDGASEGVRVLLELGRLEQKEQGHLVRQLVVPKAPGHVVQAAGAAEDQQLLVQQLEAGNEHAQRGAGENARGIAELGVVTVGGFFLGFVTQHRLVATIAYPEAAAEPVARPLEGRVGQPAARLRGTRAAGLGECTGDDPDEGVDLGLAVVPRHRGQPGASGIRRSSRSRYSTLWS